MFCGHYKCFPRKEKLDYLPWSLQICQSSLPLLAASENYTGELVSLVHSHLNSDIQ